MSRTRTQNSVDFRHRSGSWLESARKTLSIWRNSMRAMILSLLGFGLFLIPSSLRAQGDLRAVIDKAIKAHGGEATIDRHKISQTKSKGTLYLQGNMIEFTEEITVHLP